MNKKNLLKKVNILEKDINKLLKKIKELKTELKLKWK